MKLRVATSVQLEKSIEILSAYFTRSTMHMWLIVSTILLTYFLVNANEVNLYQILLKDYDIQERPVERADEAVIVRMAMVFQQIIRVDEKNQMVEVNAWLKLSWNDYKLKWKPEQFGGLDRIPLRNTLIWTPDILMYNSAHRKFDATFSTDVVVAHDGLVTWNLPGIFQLSCTVNMVWFPFDEQHCFMKFGSWTYDTSKLILKDDGNNSFDLSRYLDNGEWVLKDTVVEQTIRQYTCCPEPYFDLQFKFSMKRRTAAYAFNLIIPCTLITMLTLVGFILPPEAGEKVSYQVSLMLTVCIFQNYVSEMSPPTSEMLPFLGAFFALCMVTVCLSVVWTVVVLNLYQRDARTHYMSATVSMKF
uniref:Neur_chan_LBD domain-containing protein n=1 Tax=Syphacia muris TaxID=451379 RepID=A0A158R5R6_9BILA